MELKPELFMNKALGLAQEAMLADEVPMGAVVVYDNQIIGKGYNQVKTLKDPTAHAEMIAITAACQYLGSSYLKGAKIYITAEPCTMCMGAIKHARIEHIVYGCPEPRHGFFQGLEITKNLEIVSGVMKEEAVSLLKEFFEKKRQ